MCQCCLSIHLIHLCLSATISPSPPVMHSINREDFNHDLASEPLITEPHTTLDELLECYNATITRLIDKHAPLINKPAPSRPFNPWFTPLLFGLKDSWRRLEKVWLKSKDSYHLMRLRQISNLYHHSVVLTKKAYSTSLINDWKSQLCKLWQTINSLLHRRPPSALPTTSAIILTAFSHSSQTQYLNSTHHSVSAQISTRLHILIHHPYHLF